MDTLNTIIRFSARSPKPFHGDTRLDGFVDPEKLRHAIWLYEHIDVDSGTIRGFCTVNDVESYLLLRRATRNVSGGSGNHSPMRFAFMRSDL